jgi:hypothetical protein
VRGQLAGLLALGSCMAQQSCSARDHAGVGKRLGSGGPHAGVASEVKWWCMGGAPAHEPETRRMMSASDRRLPACLHRLRGVARRGLDGFPRTAAPDVRAAMEAFWRGFRHAIPPRFRGRIAPQARFGAGGPITRRQKGSSPRVSGGRLDPGAPQGGPGPPTEPRWSPPPLALTRTLRPSPRGASSRLVRYVRDPSGRRELVDYGMGVRGCG